MWRGLNRNNIWICPDWKGTSEHMVRIVKLKTRFACPHWMERKVCFGCCFPFYLIFRLSGRGRMVCMWLMYMCCVTRNSYPSLFFNKTFKTWFIRYFLWYNINMWLTELLSIYTELTGWQFFFNTKPYSSS